jgi:hypothetical protein
MNDGIAPRRSSSVCSLMDALAERNGAHGNTDRHRSMVVASSAQTVFGQFHAEAVGGVQLSRLGDQRLREVGMDAPVAAFVGIGQGRAGHRLPQAHVVQLGRLRRQADFDVAQALAPGQLREGHAAELLGAGQGAHSMVAAVALDDAVEGLPGQEVHDLGEQGLADVHRSLRPKQGREGGANRLRRSNRRHP